MENNIDNFINKIIHGNSIEVLKDIPDNSIDLILTSPPYDNLRKYDGFDFDFENMAKELTRVLNFGGIIVWVVADATINGSETCTSFKQALYFKENCGLKLHDTMIYKSEKPPLTHKRYEQKFEYMFVFCKGKIKTFNPILVPCKYAGSSIDRPKTTKGSRSDNSAIRSKDPTNKKVKDYKIKGNIWEYKTGGNHSTSDSIAFNHPAIFPEKLAEDHILSWTNENDIVLDPMCGSGTTCKMSLLNNRKFIGIDISKKYCDIAVNRINKIGMGYNDV